MTLEKPYFIQIGKALSKGTIREDESKNRKIAEEAETTTREKEDPEGDA